MSLVFKETFQLRAPADQVWRFLLDPERVAQCLPGAMLLGIDGPRRFSGRVSAKVGPVTANYEGQATFTDIDDARRRVVITAEGKEGTGSGSARMTMTGEVRVIDDVTTEVSFSSTVDVVGRVMQFGGGMLQSVAKQLMGQFTTCMRDRLEAEAQTAARAEATFAPALAPLPRQPQPVRPLALLLRAIADWFISLFRQRA